MVAIDRPALAQGTWGIHKWISLAMRRIQEMALLNEAFHWARLEGAEGGAQSSVSSSGFKPLWFESFLTPGGGGDHRSRTCIAMSLHVQVRMDQGGAPGGTEM